VESQLRAEIDALRRSVDGIAAAARTTASARYPGATPTPTGLGRTGHGQASSGARRSPVGRRDIVSRGVASEAQWAELYDLYVPLPVPRPAAAVPS
jgi:hypothetical protein